MIPPKPRDAVELTTRDLAVLSASGSARPEVIVAVAVHGPERDLGRCLTSVADQDLETADLGVVVLLDSHRPIQFSPALPLGLRDRTWVLRANCGSPARARNAMLEFVEQQLPWCRWVARMDWDDRFAERASLRRALEAGEAANADFVIGGNRVLDRGGSEVRINPAGLSLRDPSAIIDRLRRMANGTAENELPSCNLLLRPTTRTRYPDTPSAEDHWLVADLLIHHAPRVAILESVLYADYTLDGQFTSDAKRAQRHRASRQALHDAAQTWLAVGDTPGRLLGLGQEGVVKVNEGVVRKHFYPGILTPEKASWLENALACGQSIIPVPRFSPGLSPGSWTAMYPWEDTRAFESPSTDAVAAFLKDCLAYKLVCGNIKRPNFRVRENGQLVHIDIGNWTVPMSVSVLRDSAARLYSIGVLGASDEEVLRRPADHSRPIIWDRLPGYSEFYGRTVSQYLASHWRLHGVDASPARMPRRRDDVTLLIKACAMDAEHLERQVRHLVQQLVGPSDFYEKVLAIDAFEGPFLRQHSAGDLPKLLASARALQSNGAVDRVVVAPTDPETVRQVNLAWFGLDSGHTHTAGGTPVTPQTWAFDQVSTRYVLQCDVDALIGRRDRDHDYLADMIAACVPDDMVGIAFNIPHDPTAAPTPYHAAPGEFKPEVRCGLLDLERLRGVRPLPNRLVEGQLEQPWYRALHACQRERGLRTLRGGDHRSFYIHPLNELKRDPDVLDRVRDLMAQGAVPQSHWGRWDVGPAAADWRYPARNESVVVLARGRNTALAKLDRFAAGLEMQTDGTFGVVVIDDASTDESSLYLHDRLRFLGSRLTLIRHARPRGRMRNNVIAIRNVCTNPDSAIVAVDLDDALADPTGVQQIRQLFACGHDVVLAAPFRPDLPTKVYQPDFENPRRTFGGDVWIHLRAFAKRLFDRLPDTALQLDGQWLQECDDYATMIPIVEMATAPVYVPEFWYWHERTTGHHPAEQSHRHRIIERLLQLRPGSSQGLQVWEGLACAPCPIGTPR